MASLIVVSVLAFARALGNGFAPDFDDDLNLLANLDYRGLGWHQLHWASTTHLMGVYQPFGWLLFSLQYSVFKMNAAGYHAVSLALHAINTIVLYRLTLALLGRRAGTAALDEPRAQIAAAAAAALFAVHPLRVEVVAWISCQPYLASFLFAMLATLAYLRGRLARALACFVVAGLFKAPAFALPVVFMLLDYHPLRRPFTRRLVLEKLPFFGVAAAVAALAWWARAAENWITPLAVHGALPRLAQASYSVWFYLVKTAAPLWLVPFRPAPAELDWQSPLYIAAFAATLAVTAILFVLRRRWPGAFVVWLSYLALLAPNSGLVKISFYMVADRYGYFTTAAFAVGAAALLAESGRARQVLPAIAALVCCVWTVASIRQCALWGDPALLWQREIEWGGPENAYVLGKWGTVLVGRAQFEAALAPLSRAVELDPGNEEAQTSLAAARAALKKGSQP